MKTLMYVTAIWSVVFALYAPSVGAQTQEDKGYTFIRTVTGPQVCLGRWVPSRDVALQGTCEGQMVDLAQFTADSARLSADMLGRLLRVLEAMDQKLAVSNDQFERLIQAMVNAQTSIDEQVRQVSEFLRETIERRLDALPKEILANDEFKKELTQMKEDILREVEKRYPQRPKPATR